MITKEIQMIYQDIVFSHNSYSPIIFDSMYEMIDKTINNQDYNPSSLVLMALDKAYLQQLKSLANTGRHTMKVKEFILKHNVLIGPFNVFLTQLKEFDPIEEYHIEPYEYAPKSLNLSKVFDQFHIIKLYEQFSVMYVHGHKRAFLRLQMFFESSIRYHTKEYEKDFVHMINTPSIIKDFVDYISDKSYSLAQQKTFVNKMMDLNKIRNDIKKRSTVSVDININDLEKYAMLISLKLEQEIAPYDRPIFTSTQALLEYRNAFRELSFDYRYQVYNNLGNDCLTAELMDIYKNDLAYQVYIINTLMEGLKMKQINDFDKIFQTIDQFEEMVKQLSKINEQYSDTKEVFDEVAGNLKDFHELNSQINILSKVNFQKLSEFVNVQDEFTDGIKLSSVLTKFKERTEDIKDINQQVKELKKSVTLLEKQVKSQLLDQK